MLEQRRSPVLLICCCLMAYFGFHAIHGKHGIESRRNLEVRAQVLAGELRVLDAVRSRLAKEVTLLDGSRPDRDYVEEIARGLLAFAHPADRIVLPVVASDGSRR
jgi:cell division protein FtsB